MKIMNNLKENYEQALGCIDDMLKYNKYDKEETIRLKTKASCYRTFLNELNQVLNIDLVSKTFTDEQINEVADDMADDYCNDVTDPVWRGIRKDSIKAIKAFIDKHL